VVLDIWTRFWHELLKSSTSWTSLSCPYVLSHTYRIWPSKGPNNVVKWHPVMNMLNMEVIGYRRFSRACCQLGTRVSRCAARPVPVPRNRIIVESSVSDSLSSCENNVGKWHPVMNMLNMEVICYRRFSRACCQLVTRVSRCAARPVPVPCNRVILRVVSQTLLAWLG
jgi:hypothetical protein